MRLVLSDQYLLIISEERNTSLIASDESIRLNKCSLLTNTLRSCVCDIIHNSVRRELLRVNLEYGVLLQNCYTICTEIELDDVISGGSHSKNTRL